jgi:uridine kinase
VLCLDDFYKDGTDPTLPSADGAVDWESPASWDAVGAVRAIAELAATGRTRTPVYDISRSETIDTHPFDLDGSPLFIAEGIFAAEIVADCLAADMLADALALHRPRTVTFVRRLVRDMAEHRKPPAVLVRRGARLWREDNQVLARQNELGCRSVTAAMLIRRVDHLVRTASRTPA